jgi:hypothetical protein
VILAKAYGISPREVRELHVEEIAAMWWLLGEIEKEQRTEEV